VSSASSAASRAISFTISPSTSSTAATVASTSPLRASSLLASASSARGGQSSDSSGDILRAQIANLRAGDGQRRGEGARACAAHDLPYGQVVEQPGALGQERGENAHLHALHDAPRGVHLAGQSRQLHAALEVGTTHGADQRADDFDVCCRLEQVRPVRQVARSSDGDDLTQRANAFRNGRYIFSRASRHHPAAVSSWLAAFASRATSTSSARPAAALRDVGCGRATSPAFLLWSAWLTVSFGTGPFSVVDSSSALASPRARAFESALSTAV
jgi:hypothetical protein